MPRTRASGWAGSAVHGIRTGSRRSSAPRFAGAPPPDEHPLQFKFLEPQSLPNPMLAFSDDGLRLSGERARREIVDQRRPLGTRWPAHRHPGRQRPRQIDAGEDHRRANWRRCPAKITEGKGLTIGYFAQQELDVLHPHDAPADAHGSPGARHRAQPGARAGAARFPRQLQLHGDMVKQPGGHHERRRESPAGAGDAGLAAPQPAPARRADQPPGPGHREALAMALNEFEGTVMLVSHDRALLRSVCDEFWLVGRGVLQPLRRRPRRLPAATCSTPRARWRVRSAPRIIEAANALARSQQAGGPQAQLTRTAKAGRSSQALARSVGPVGTAAGGPVCKSARRSRPN